MTEVSIIVPVRNQKQYIKRCLDSILEQKTVFSIEVLIGDDCSTDGTREILSEYAAKDEKIKLFLRNTQMGATQNVVDLCKKMTGRFFAYLEGDDYWCDENKLQKQYDFLSSHPDCVGCFHDVRLVDENDHPIRKKLSWVTTKKTVSFDSYDGYHLPGHSSSWFRKNLYLSNPDVFSFISEAHEYIGDRTAALCFLSFGNFKKIDGVMSCYRYVRNDSSDNLTSKIYPKHQNSALKEISLLDKMELCCTESLHRPKSFNKRRQEIAAYSFLFLLKHPNSENKEAFDRAYERLQKKILFWIQFPFISLSIIMKKNIRA